MTATHCTPCGHRLPGHYPVCEHYEPDQDAEYDFVCTECGPVVHDPTDPCDSAHCPCDGDGLCGCACHNPSTLTAVL